MKILLPIMLLSFFLTGALSLPAQSAAPNLRNFSIMVIPYLKDGEKINEKLQKSAHIRMAIANLQDAFLSNGLKIIDFSAKYQKYYQDQVMTEPTSDTKAQFVQYAAPDIFAEIETEEIDCGDGTHKARVRLKTFLTATSELMADKVSDSNCFVKEADFVLLIKQSFNKFLEQYITQMQDGLTRMVDLGQPLELRITVLDDAGFDLNSIVRSSLPQLNTTAPLSKMIALWLYKDSKIKSSTPPSNSAQLVVYDEIRISLLDENNRKIYPLELFRYEVWNFFNDLQLVNNAKKVKITVQDNSIGRTIYISLE